MAYDETSVPAARSQEAIRKLVYAHKGTAVMFISQRPKEGFEAVVTLSGDPYHIRVMATCAPKRENRAIEQEERRVWRVLFFHLKAMFEAADSGVIDMRDVILPYIVTPDNRTLSEHILPRMKEVQANPGRLLNGGRE
jgi:hypothetical protein